MSIAPQLTKFTRLPKIICYGVPGLGKSKLASSFPKPAFIPTTDGLEGLGVFAFPVAQTAQAVRDAIQWLRTEQHDFKTAVLDTLGWMEKLVHDEVCHSLGLEFMTQSSVKSYPLAALKMREIKESLDALNRERKMFIVMIAHATVSKFEDPTTATYDRYAMQMNEKVAEMFMQDADIVAFMNQKVMIREEKDGFSKANKASANGRHLFFDPCPAFYAKDHGYGLPDEMRIPEEDGFAAIWEFMRVKFNAAPQPAAAAPAMPGDAAASGTMAAVAAEQKKRRAAKAEKAAAEKAASDADDVPASFIAPPPPPADIKAI